MSDYGRSHLEQLESEAIHIIREVAAQFDRPVLLFSGGKDSVTLAHVAKKAFLPGRIPFPLMHVDTGHNFPETLIYRDRFIEEGQLELIVRSVQDSIDQGRVAEPTGKDRSRNSLQTVTLLDAIKEFRFDACLGGARRDEEKARSKERIFSHRDAFGQWDPKHQRPELWRLYNGMKGPDENFRVFPLSNWTELDIWHYLRREEVELPSLYFAHERDVVIRNGVMLAMNDFIELEPEEKVTRRQVRFRTIGDLTCTGASESGATTIDEVIEEVAKAMESERGARADDQRSEAAMEDRKRHGYF